ncbi:hypothetical protein ACQ5SP_16435, partial [Rhodovulum sp. YNF3179]|uniref:hypothetical protein n=1 Tax=Rhodovulum sp. YNF3179 TaxID=3425127 RepID=UPI003D33ED5A
RTSTAHAPWCVLPANNKKYARIAAMHEIVERLSADVDLSPPSLGAAVLEEAKKHFDLPEPFARHLSRSPQ